MVVECSRAVLVMSGAQPEDVTPEGFNLRTVVHEYGRGAFKLVDHGDAVVFSNFADQRLYKHSLDGGMAMPHSSFANYESADYWNSADRVLCFCSNNEVHWN